MGTNKYNLIYMTKRHRFIGDLINRCSLRHGFRPSYHNEQWVQVETLLNILRVEGLLHEADQTQPRADAGQVPANAGDAQRSDSREPKAA